MTTTTTYRPHHPFHAFRHYQLAVATIRQWLPPAPPSTNRWGTTRGPAYRTFCNNGRYPTTTTACYHRAPPQVARYYAVHAFGHLPHRLDRSPPAAYLLHLLYRLPLPTLRFTACCCLTSPPHCHRLHNLQLPPAYCSDAREILRHRLTAPLPPALQCLGDVSGRHRCSAGSTKHSYRAKGGFCPATTGRALTAHTACRAMRAARATLKYLRAAAPRRRALPTCSATAAACLPAPCHVLRGHHRTAALPPRPTRAACPIALLTACCLVVPPHSHILPAMPLLVPGSTVPHFCHLPALPAFTTTWQRSGITPVHVCTRIMPRALLPLPRAAHLQPPHAHRAALPHAAPARRHVALCAHFTAPLRRTHPQLYRRDRLSAFAVRALAIHHGMTHVLRATR